MTRANGNNITEESTDMASPWARLIKRINTALDSFVDGVADELHAMDMKEPDHLFWHPDCTGHTGKKN